jgi:hypothetical protein
MIKITPEHIIQFLQDEGLSSSLRTKNLQKENWKININEPWENDNKQRCGIFQARDKKTGRLKVFFNSFKAVANMGDDYKGTFWKFVKLIKNFENLEEAKVWFLHRYILGRFSKADIQDDEHYTPKEIVNSLYFPLEWPRWEDNNDFKEYSYYLFTRRVTSQQIQNVKLFINPEERRIVFPVYESNTMVFYTGRSIDPHAKVPWRKSTGESVFPIWNLENVNGDVVNVFEGIFDALMIPNGVAILGANTYAGEEIVNKLLYKNFLRINLFLDNDKAGFAAKYKLATALSAKHNNVWIYDYSGVAEKDFNLMKINGTDFALERRLLPWNLKTETMIKMNLVL